MLVTVEGDVWSWGRRYEKWMDKFVFVAIEVDVEP